MKLTTRFALSPALMVLAALLLAACEVPDASPPSKRSARVPGAAEIAPVREAAPVSRETLVTTLAGEWRVAGIDGEPLDERYGLALRGDEANLWWEPKCAAMWRTYRIEGGRIAFGFPRHLRQSDGSTAAVCAIGLPPRLQDVFRALDAAESVARTRENGILISGGGRSVTLFSQ